MRRSLVPPLYALIAFESVARYGSIMRAANELHLSQSAVSRLVKQVEDAIQVRLFDRIRQRLILTEAGSAYAQDVRKLLSGFEQSTLQVMAYGSGGQAGTINLGVFSTFSMKWLIPRLEDYRATRPNTVISCYARPQPFSFDEDPLDAAIHYGEPIWPGASVEPLFGEQLIPICSPTLPGLRELKTPQDMMKFPLLHEVTRPWSWKHWFEQQGVTIGSPLLGARFDQFSMVAQAAKAGLGIGLVPHFLFAQEIQSGELHVPLNRPIAGEHMYYFVYPHRNAANAVVLDFRDWIVAAAGQQQPA